MSEIKNSEQSAIGVVSTCFSPYNYACDRWNETLSILTEQDILGLNQCKDEEDVDEYMCTYSEIV